MERSDEGTPQGGGIHLLLHRVLEMNRAEGRRRGQQHEVRLAEDADGLLEGVQPAEPPLRRHIHSAANFREMFLRPHSTRSWNTSAIATSLTGPAVDRALATAAPVPRPPQPT